RLLIAGRPPDVETVKTTLLEVAPAVLTVMLTDPGVVMRLASTIPDNCVALPKILASGDPFHRIVELAANADPFTVSVNADPPAAADVGLILLMFGVAGP